MSVGVSADSDGDGSPDSIDQCPLDVSKISPGVCGCGVADQDQNSNGITDCLVNPEFKAQIRSIKALARKLRSLTGLSLKKARAQKKLRSQLKKAGSSLQNFGSSQQAAVQVAASANVKALSARTNRLVRSTIKASSSSLVASRKKLNKNLNQLLRVIL